MFALADNRFVQSRSPHSLALANDLTIPSVFDSHPLLRTQKQFWGAGMQGLGQFDLSTIQGTFTEAQTFLQQQFFGIELWKILAGGVAAWWLLTPHGRKYREEKKALKAKHRGYQQVAGWLE